jgi:hypothetical protein
MLRTYCTQHTWLPGVRDKWHEKAISSTGVEPRRLGEPSELTHDAPITSDEHIKRGARSEHGDLLAVIISNDAAVAIALAAKGHRDFCFLHHRTHIAENGEDFCALGDGLVALVAMVVIAVALLAQQQIEIVDLDLLCFQGGSGPMQLVLQNGECAFAFRRMSWPPGSPNRVADR